MVFHVGFSLHGLMVFHVMLGCNGLQDVVMGWCCRCSAEETINGSAVLTEGFHPVTLEYFEKSEPQAHSFQLLMLLGSVRVC